MTNQSNNIQHVNSLPDNPDNNTVYIIRRKEYETRFVDTIPEEMEDGVLYVAPHFECAMHLCMCGCGEKVCTPITTGQWSWTYDGKHVSLNPSIGNFQYSCKSHYFLKNGKVIWC